MSDTTRQGGTKPAAMAMPKGGFSKDKIEQGRYGPIFPKTPACYGFSIIAKIIPGREEVFYEHARNIEFHHSLRWHGWPAKLLAESFTDEMKAGDCASMECF